MKKVIKALAALAYIFLSQGEGRAFNPKTDIGILPRDVMLEVLSEKPVYAVRELRRYYKGAACKGLESGVVLRVGTHNDNNVVVHHVPNPRHPTQIVKIRCPTLAQVRLPNDIWNEAQQNWFHVELSVRNAVVRALDKFEERLNKYKPDMPRAPNLQQIR